MVSVSAVRLAGVSISSENVGAQEAPVDSNGLSCFDSVQTNGHLCRTPERVDRTLARRSQLPQEAQMIRLAITSGTLEQGKILQTWWR